MENPSLLWVIPFVAMLLTIAVAPLASPHFWEKNLNKALVSLVLALPVTYYLLFHNPHALLHTTHEYFSFITLLASLFVITGGIHLTGDLKATPLVNTSFLAIGSLLASVIGTTGASMLLIRTLLRTNRERHHVKHIPIFFIFIVSNIGGLLTAVGDPPLFLGYLRGVPFFWTFKLFPIWFFCVGILLLLFYLIDTLAYKKETKKDLRADAAHIEPLAISGHLNLIPLAGVILAVFLHSPIREGGMLFLAIASFKLTPEVLHKKNRFEFGPMIEVAILFAGIFITMVPALSLLEQNGGKLGISEPVQFFWLTGLLSSFLDNAPTYLTFLSLGQGLNFADASIVGVTVPVLKAISAGAVLMGANTYIGNGPNFMVKAIAESMKIKTPSFFGYMAYSGGILIPLFIAVTFLFFI